MRPEWSELPCQEWSEQRESEVSPSGTGMNGFSLASVLDLIVLTY